MPIYEYVCLDCGNRFELLVLRSEEEVICPSCECARLERVMSPFARSASAGGSSFGCSGSGGFS